MAHEPFIARLALVVDRSCGYVKKSLKANKFVDSSGLKP
jgi:hypothetical protein